MFPFASASVPSARNPRSVASGKTEPTTARDNSDILSGGMRFLDGCRPQTFAGGQGETKVAHAPSQKPRSRSCASLAFQPRGLFAVIPILWMSIAKPDPGPPRTPQNKRELQDTTPRPRTVPPDPMLKRRPPSQSHPYCSAFRLGLYTNAARLPPGGSQPFDHLTRPLKSLLTADAFVDEPCGQRNDKAMRRSACSVISSLEVLSAADVIVLWRRR